MNIKIRNIKTGKEKVIENVTYIGNMSTFIDIKINGKVKEYNRAIWELRFIHEVIQ